LIERLDDETVVYDVESKQAHALSALASAVFADADGKTSIGELALAASARLGEPVDERHVLDALAQLEERELMVAPLRVRNGLSRRDLVRKSAGVGAAAFAAPLITTIVAPTPAAAVTATCGTALCCPCCFGSGGQSCCDAPDATPNCNCTAAEGTCKQCKVTSAATDVVCSEAFPGGFPPEGNCICGRCVCDLDGPTCTPAGVTCVDTTAARRAKHEGSTQQSSPAESPTTSTPPATTESPPSAPPATPPPTDPVTTPPPADPVVTPPAG
jgi:hypothetical protein